MSRGLGSERSFQEPRKSNQRMGRTQLEPKYRVAEIVPVDYEMCIANEADGLSNQKCWDGWRILASVSEPHHVTFLATADS